MKLDKTYPLDAEERAILKAYQSGKLKSVPNLETEKKRIQALFKAHAKKLHRVNIRLNEIDYLTAQEWAMREGIPSATLLSSLLHKTLSQQMHAA